MLTPIVPPFGAFSVPHSKYKSDGRKHLRNRLSFNSPTLSSVCFGVLALCTSISVPAWSQAVYGTVVGTVSSMSGKPIDGATITALSVEKGTRVRVTSNSSGLFTITHLLSDTYNIRAEAPGYVAREVQGEDVHADQDVNLSVQLEEGSGTGGVQLTKTKSFLKTDRADVATLLSVQEVQDLPNFVRNFTAFELLAPGALNSTILANTGRPSQNPQQGLQIYQNGQHFSGSAFQLDGTDNRDPIAGLIVINPPLESISEIKITTQNFDAEFGQSLAGLVTAQTRSGSNTWHGSLFEFRHTDWAEASPPNLQNSNVTQNSFKINQFGGAFGGPIIANRVFIFGDYQGNRRALDFRKFSTVPTETTRSSCLDPSRDCDLTDYGKAINYPIIKDDPKSGEQFECTIDGAVTHMCIPRAFVSSQAMNLLQLLPPANVPNPTDNILTFQNYTASGDEPWNDDEFDVRVDQNLSSKLKLFGRYSFFDSRIDADGIFGNLIGGTGLSSDNFAGASRSRNQSVSTGFDYVLTPRLTTDFRFGFYRYHVHVLQGGLGTTPANDAGIAGLNMGDSYTSGMPAFVILQPAAAVTSNIAFGYSQEVNNCNCPLLENEQQFQWANNWTKLYGSHNVKLGVDFRYAQNLRVPSDRHRAGHLVFSQQTTGLGLASFLEGYASAFDRYVGTDFSAGERQHRYFFYGQDNWRVTSRFTLTFGLRWELYTPQSVTGTGQGGFLDVTTGLINVAGLDSNLQGNVRDSFTNFAPRLGFAYHIRPHTVLRAAYGRSFDLGSLGAVFGDTVTQNLPVLKYEQFLPDFPGQEVFNLRQPAPTRLVPPIVGGQIKLPNGVAANVLPTTIRIPTIDAWNVTIQQELSSKTSIELAYVANKGTRLFPEESSNQSKTASYNLNQATIQGFVDTTNQSLCVPNAQNVAPNLPCISVLSSRQPYYSVYGWTQLISYFGNNAGNSYESFQAKLEGRFTQGIQFRAAYTWSKGLGYAQDYFAIDPRVNFGPNDFDRTHSFVLSTLWELPFGRGKALFGNARGLRNRVVGGWELNTISYLYSGLPFTPTYAASECAMDIDTGPCRPNRVGYVHNTGNRNGYFTVAGSPLTNSSFAAGPAEGPWQRPASGIFGSAGRNSLRGPDFSNTDLTLLKNLNFTERFTVQFSAQITNLFNRVNLGLPNACVDCQPIGGLPTSAVITNLLNGATMRQLEFAFKLQF
jgi:outer membrane receptor protein involved in Fe transport